MAEDNKGVEAKAIRAFEVSFDGITTKAIAAGEIGLVPSDAVQGLIDCGYIEGVDGFDEAPSPRRGRPRKEA